MAGKVFVTGGSGFVGSAVIEELLSRGYAVNALTNSRKIDAAVTSIKGSMFDDALLADAMRGCDAVIHLVGIIMENPSKGVTFDRIHHQGTVHVVDAAKKAGVKRYVQMSALGTRPDAASEYHKTKYLAEQYVRASGLDWTIIRPSMIHGPKGEFMKQEAKWARGTAPPFLFMPYFGAGPLGCGGAGKLQPVYVGDVARAFVDAIEKPNTIGEVYPLGGATVLTWFQMHRAIAHAITGKKRMVMALPAWYAKLITHIVPGSLLPFNEAQVIMSQEDNTCDNGKVTADFGWSPQAFEPVLETYAKQL
ncbi:NAD(P)H-binding protein [soil metagenome]